MGGGQTVIKKKNLITPKPQKLGFRFRKRFPIFLSHGRHEPHARRIQTIRQIFLILRSSLGLQ